MRFYFQRPEHEAQQQTMIPAVAIYEEEKAVVLEAEMPGFEKDNITVDVNQNELVLRAEAKPCETPKGYTPLYRERCGRIYERTFTLSDDIDQQKISAQYENGVLRLTLGKSEKTQPKRITIN